MTDERIPRTSLDFARWHIAQALELRRRAEQPTPPKPPLPASVDDMTAEWIDQATAAQGPEHLLHLARIHEDAAARINDRLTKRRKDRR